MQLLLMVIVPGYIDRMRMFNLINLSILFINDITTMQ